METMPRVRDAGRLNTLASSTVPAVRERDHVTGSDSPTLTLVEYGDFGCPFCFAASRAAKALLDRFDGLRLVWRHLPALHLHPRANIAAEPSELAALHGKFWDAHSLLLTPHGRFSYHDLLSVAGRLELNPAETQAALREHWGAIVLPLGYTVHEVFAGRRQPIRCVVHQRRPSRSARSRGVGGRSLPGPAPGTGGAGDRARPGVGTARRAGLGGASSGRTSGVRARKLST